MKTIASGVTGALLAFHVAASCLLAEAEGDYQMLFVAHERGDHA